MSARDLVGSYRKGYQPGELCDPDAELAVLKVMLLDGCTAKARSLLDAEHFYFDEHRQAFEAMAALDAQGLAVDRITLAAALQERRAHGAYDVSFDSPGTADKLESYASRIRTLATRRKRYSELQAAARALQAEASSLFDGTWKPPATGASRTTPAAPHDEDAERAVLSAMLVDDGTAAARSLLDPSHFYRTAHRRAFEAMLAVADRGAGVDNVTLMSELRARGDFDVVGGHEFLSRVAGSPGTAANIPAYASTIRDKAARRVRLRELDAETDRVRDGAWTPATASGNGSTTATRPGQQGTVLVLEDAEPHPEPVDGEALFADLVAAVGLYVVLPPGGAVTVALWAALTYLTDVVDVLPRLLLTSPTKACGKTRLLALLGVLARRPVPASSITASALFRVIAAWKPTLLLDEMDNARLTENDELCAVLNSGHTRDTAFTLRNVGDDHEPRHFPTWAAIALAAIGRLRDTTASRCVLVRMRRRAPGERVDRMRSAQLKADFAPLRARLARWCQDHAEAVQAAVPAVPASLDDRGADNWAPLLAIADSIGGRWPVLARQAAEGAAGAQADEDTAVMLLADLRGLLAERGDHVASEELVVALGKMDGRPWPDWYGKAITTRGVARLLQPFGIGSRNLKVSGRVVKGYAATDCRDAFTRYLPPVSATALPAAIDAAGTPISHPLPKAEVADGPSAASPSVDGPGSGVADTKPEQGGERLSTGTPATVNGAAAVTPADPDAKAQPIPLERMDDVLAGFGWGEPDGPAPHPREAAGPGVTSAPAPAPGRGPVPPRGGAGDGHA